MRAIVGVVENDANIIEIMLNQVGLFRAFNHAECLSNQYIQIMTHFNNSKRNFKENKVVLI